MELLEKFAAVEVLADNRITETDKEYCEQHQKAYETAISSFKELALFWEDMNAEQQRLLGDKNSPNFYNYLASHDGLSISQQAIERHIESLHMDLIMTLTRYFNTTYHVTVDSSEVSGALLPAKPERSRLSDQLEASKKYHEQMQSFTIRYQDIVDQIILWLDGRSFSEQAFHELYTKCHKAAWNTYKQESEFTQRKDTIQFSEHFCRMKGWPYNGWEIYDSLKDILYGLAHFETGSYRVLPEGFSTLLGYYEVKESVVEFPFCKKVKQLKLFKNGRVDLKFSSPEYATQFINKYLGTVC